MWLCVLSIHPSPYSMPFCVILCPIWYTPTGKQTQTLLQAPLTDFSVTACNLKTSTSITHKQPVLFLAALNLWKHRNRTFQSWYTHSVILRISRNPHSLIHVLQSTYSFNQFIYNICQNFVLFVPLLLTEMP